MRHPGELLSAYLDGEATAQERHRVVEHLARCGACLVELEELQAARAALRALPILEVPAELMAGGTVRVLAIHRRTRVWLGAAAAAVAVVIGLATLLAPQPAVVVSVDELSSPFGARGSVDPAFSPAKVVLPAEVPAG